MSKQSMYTDLLFTISSCGLTQDNNDRKKFLQNAIEIIKKMDKIDLDKVSMGNSPLLLAAKYGLNDIVNELLEKKVNPNIANYKGITPLMKAAKYGHSDVVKTLLNGGADENIKNWRGQTALKIAEANGKNSVVQLLSNKSKPMVSQATAPSTIFSFGNSKVTPEHGGRYKKTRKQRRRKTNRRRKGRVTKKR